MSSLDLLLASRVAILGLGLMGGSLALALRGRCTGLIGVDPDPAAVEMARQHWVVDEAYEQPGPALSQADAVILAAPVGAILQLLRQLPDLHPGSPIVLDLGSTKTLINQVMAALPERFEAVGGHPMCGKESSSLANADPLLYQGAPFAFTPNGRTTGRARAFAVQLAQAVGAFPLWLEPEVHDRWVAATSHLPYLVSNALATVTPAEAAPLVGPGYRSATRLSVTPAGIMLDILASNQANVLEALGRLREQLASIEAQLAQGDFESLRESLERGAAQQKKIIPPVERGAWS